MAIDVAYFKDYDVVCFSRNGWQIILLAINELYNFITSPLELILQQLLNEANWIKVNIERY